MSKNCEWLEIWYPVSFSTLPPQPLLLPLALLISQVGIKHPREKYATPQFKNNMSVIKKRFLILKTENPTHVKCMEKQTKES